MTKTTDWWLEEDRDVELEMDSEEWYLEGAGIHSMDGNFLLIHEWEEEERIDDMQWEMIEEAYDVLLTDPRIEEVG